MAQAFTLIQRQVLASNASSVQFTNIPQTYTDLKLVISARNTDTGNFGNILVSINGSSSSYVNQYLQGNGSGLGSGQVAQMVGDMNTTTSTTDTFNNIEVYFPNYAGSNQKQFSADSVAETNAATAYLMLMANTWNVTDAITSLTITNRNAGLNFVTNSTFTLYGIGGAKATGGTITADARYTYHTFTSSGTFTALEKIKNAEALVIAGGGGGGSYRGGGGGAGGVLYGLQNTLNAGTSHSVIVGAGGAGGAGNVGFAVGNVGVQGSSSMFRSLMPIGGGRGATAAGGAAGSGGTGGSGGGTCSPNPTGGSGTVGQGNNGGAGDPTYSGKYGAGGGGGAGGVGTAGTSLTGGAGGPGTSVYSAWGTATSTGENVNGTFYYAGGGGGGAIFTAPQVFGGIGGGGGSSTNSDGGAGTANTGGGGAGANSTDDTTTRNGGAGGSGLVIIRYPN